MATIILQTDIAAPRERVFDLARSIDAHQDTAAATGERAVAGVTSGLLGLDEEVTWQAKHFGVVQKLRVKMTLFERPSHFRDVMLEGAFRSMQHDHSFSKNGMMNFLTFSPEVTFEELLRSSTNISSENLYRTGAYLQKHGEPCSIHSIKKSYLT